ncbi:hypothetical protein EV356DRAFT_564250 [Viridothelium virens]|uniref:Uncharacterized protein n=1 Tax=Viridothelium virens TaxID=1048519 RepID=A0A6A6HKP9_VIRVR|nr:hypothetical protein EV356DRAFT_564250 [Viridothelium virens]
MSSSSGTKVTNDPEAFRNPVNEGPGTVTSDSLAAESLSRGGNFAANQPSAGAMSQPSYSTTTNTTDTSNTTRLDPAPDAESRDVQQGWSEQQQLEAGRGLGKEAGVGPTFATSGGVGGTSSSAGGLSDRDTGGAISGSSKPHGKNITEGGADFDNAPNASFNNDIGGPNDPGRYGEQRAQRSNAESGLDAGRGQRQGGIEGENLYDTVGESNA